MTADTEETVAAAEKGGPKSGSAGGKQEAGPGTAAEGQGNATGAPQKTVATMLGEAVWLLSQSSTHKYFTLADLEWLLMPPILLQQFRVYYHEDQPQAIALWAFLSEDAERRLDMTAMSGQGARLAPNDWKSGDHLWLVDLVVPNSDREGQATKLMLADLAKNVFPGRSMKMHVTDPATGKREVKVIGLGRSGYGRSLLSQNFLALCGRIPGMGSGSRSRRMGGTLFVSRDTTVQPSAEMKTGEQQ